MRLRSLCLTFLALCFLCSRALAEDYVEPTWPNLARTLVRFNALDLSDTSILDEYIIVTECNLYQSFYHDDFKWNEVRKAARKSVQLNVASFPTGYHYDAKLQLDRYDFASKIFRLAEKSMIHNVNTFSLFSIEGTGCGAADVGSLPRVYKAVISVPIYIDGLPLSEQDGNALLKQMEQEHNSDRIVHARFNLRIIYVDPIRRLGVKDTADPYFRYGQSNSTSSRSVRLDARLDSIEFFEDEQRTHLIYKYQP